MWVSASRDPEGPQRGGADLVDAGVLGSGDVAREQHRPLDPRVAQDLERRRLVVGDRGPHGVAADRDAVEGVLLADEELLEQGRLLGAGRHGVQPALRASRRRRAGRSPASRRRPAAWRPAGSRPRRANAVASAAPVTSACAAHGHPGLAEHVLHPRLVAHVVGGLLVHALDAHAPRAPGPAAPGAARARRPDAPPGPSGRPSPVTASAIWRGSRALSTRQCPDSRSRSAGGIRLERVAGDQPEPDAGESGGVGDEPRGCFHEVRRDEGCGRP